MQNCFECEVFKKHEREKRFTKVFKWHSFGLEKPTVSNVEYIVLINGAELPTSLIWNGDSFVDHDGNTYCVKLWGEIPELPKLSEER